MHGVKKFSQKKKNMLLTTSYIAMQGDKHFREVEFSIK
jgi:hypothetical protein